jgi:hypothetical protein
MTDAKKHKRVLIEVAISAVDQHNDIALECAGYGMADEAADHTNDANMIRAAIRWLEGLSDDQ